MDSLFSLELIDGSLGARRAEDDIVLARVDEDVVVVEERLEHRHDADDPIAEQLVLHSLVEDGVGHGTHMERSRHLEVRGEGGERRG